MVDLAEPLERQYYASAPFALRQWWKDLREAAETYGFGRCETLPIKTEAERVARYVGSYIGKELRARQSQDRGLRTVRYSLDRRRWGYRWSFVGGGQRVWRQGCTILGAIMGTDDLSAVLGKRWAWEQKKKVHSFGRYFAECSAWLAVNVVEGTASERYQLASGMAEELWEIERAMEAQKPKQSAPEGQPGAKESNL